MNDHEVKAWLECQWQTVLALDNDNNDPDIDALVNSKVVSIRYALMAQLLGKIADRGRDILSMQRGKDPSIDDTWNARSFCQQIIVPWVFDNHNVLGTSADPYVNKPLRRPSLVSDTGSLRDGDEWQRLVDFLEPLNEASSNELKRQFRRCLAGVARRLSRQAFTYPIPKRVSLPTLDSALRQFLDEQSGGLRPLVVATSLMRVVGRGFSLFTRVEAQGLNEADAHAGVPGDIMCYDEDEIVLVVEVKDQSLTLTDVQSTTKKVWSSADPISNLIFMTDGVSTHDSISIAESMSKAWASGLNLYQADILDAVANIFVLLHESHRIDLLREVGEELDSRATHEHRQAWLTIVSVLGD